MHTHRHTREAAEIGQEPFSLVWGSTHEQAAPPVLWMILTKEMQAASRRILTRRSSNCSTTSSHRDLPGHQHILLTGLLIHTHTFVSHHKEETSRTRLHTFNPNVLN